MRKLVIPLIFICVLLLGILAGCAQKKDKSATEEDFYKPNWESLSQYTYPQWFEDAVLGIYCHWGVYSVPGFRFNDGAEEVDSGLWYGWFMYIPNDDGQDNYGCYDHHIKTYGDPCENGYHIFVPMFKAENWDPDQWAKMYKEAGADFAGLAAEHGDGFIMWDSEFDKFNVMDKGPKRDIMGDLFASLEKEGLKTFASFHEPPSEMFEEVAHFCPDNKWFNDPEYADLYKTSSFDVLNKKLLEVVDNYKPDQIWFEDAYCGEENWKPFIAHYFNSARKWGKEVCISQKHDLAPLEVAVFDIEGGIFPEGNWVWAGMEEPQEHRWQKGSGSGNSSITKSSSSMYRWAGSGPMLKV